MGVAVSDWRLARAVSLRGQLGVVSGTALDTVLTHRLQLGDIGGHIRQALDHFPIRDMAERIWEKYFIPGGKDPNAPYKSKPILSITPPRALVELSVVANFVEVWLAKFEHDGLIGINLLEKIQIPTLHSLYGAMLANVDVVLMGAGIPRQIPGVLDTLSRGEKAELRIDLAGGDSTNMVFDPAEFGFGPVKRPTFFAIVTSASLGQMLAKKCSPPVDGFVIELNTAGGHNAPPRGTMQLNEAGEPIYGERDMPDLEKFRELGLPFYLAGGYGSKEKLAEAISEGAKGIQVGTAFAFCNESGLAPEIKAEVISRSRAGTLSVYTDPKASPTGFPFKVVQVEGTIADPEIVAARRRICDLGYLREPYRTDAGKISYRCPAEPEEDFARKGGCPSETEGRKCVCNGLLSTVGMGQIHKGYHEPALITAGDDVAHVAQYLKPGQDSYTAGDVIDSLLG